MAGRAADLEIQLIDDVTGIVLVNKFTNAVVDPHPFRRADTARDCSRFARPTSSGIIARNRLTIRRPQPRHANGANACETPYAADEYQCFDPRGLAIGPAKTEALMSDLTKKMRSRTLTVRLSGRVPDKSAHEPVRDPEIAPAVIGQGDRPVRAKVLAVHLIPVIQH